MARYTMESKMPFGKNKGLKLGDIKYSYIRWLINQDWFEGELKEFMEENIDEFPYTDGNIITGGDMMSGSMNEGYDAYYDVY